MKILGGSVTKQQAARAFRAGAAAESRASHASVLIHIGDETNREVTKRREVLFERWWKTQSRRRAAEKAHRG